MGKFKAAVIQAAPVFLNLEASVQKYNRNGEGSLAGPSGTTDLGLENLRAGKRKNNQEY